MTAVIDNPAYESQAIFRAVMDAFAAPGRRLAIPAINAPEILVPATAAVLRTLADFETPVWLDQPFATQDVRQWLQFTTGAPIAKACDQAAFAVIAGDLSNLALDRFAAGSAEYPDRSTTVIVQVNSLSEGDRYELHGPGIKTSHTITVHPLPVDFETALAGNHALFPRGVDLLLAARREIVALPRSVQAVRKA